MARYNRIEPAALPGNCRVELFGLCDDELFVFVVDVAFVRKNIDTRISAYRQCLSNACEKTVRATDIQYIRLRIQLFQK
jgi:hypothetical protein